MDVIEYGVNFYRRRFITIRFENKLFILKKDAIWKLRCLYAIETNA